MKRNRASIAGLVGVVGLFAGCGGGGAPPDPFARTPHSVDLGFDAEAMAASLEVVDRYFSGSECVVYDRIVGDGGLRRLLRMDVRVVNMGDTDVVVGDLVAPLPPFGPAAVEEDLCSGGLRLAGALGYLLTAADGTLVAEGRRGAPCLSDSEEFAPGAESHDYSCEFQGLSSGWAAVRRRDEPGAWIDVTGFPEGEYTLVLTIDPDGAVPQRLDWWPDTIVLPVHIPAPTDRVADDHPTDASAEAPLAVPAVVDARIEYAGDVDAFAVSVTAGQPYRVWVEPVPGLAGVLDLRAGEDGLLLGGPAPLGAESPIDGLPAADGVVVIRVEADAVSSGPYRLHVEPAPPPDDHPNAASGASLVVVPSVTEAELATPGDADWFAVDVVAGRTYTFRTELLTHLDTVLGLYSGDGTILFAYGDDAEGTRASLVVYTAPADGRMTLRVASYAMEQTGSYRLVVE